MVTKVAILQTVFQVHFLKKGLSILIGFSLTIAPIWINFDKKSCHYSNTGVVLKKRQIIAQTNYTDAHLCCDLLNQGLCSLKRHSLMGFWIPIIAVDLDVAQCWEQGMHPAASFLMMTSSNGNIFRVTGHLCGEFTGPRWIPHTKASDAELWCLLWSEPE